jgi:hypothetical protein
MIKTMIRGNQEDRVGSVHGRQVVKEEEVEEEEEEMKTENLEGTESTEIVSRMGSGAILGEISGRASPLKRTTPNNSQVVSTRVSNDSK